MKTIHKDILLASLIAIAAGGLNAQTLPSAPRLVVSLTIDQLRTDYMEYFAPLYGERGFKRLLREGKVYTYAEMPFAAPDRASAIATLQTGAVPSQHGIVAENWMDTKTLRPINCVDDAAFMGNYTDESSSANSLLVTNVADELRIATRNRALVYSIAPFRDAAILSAGHAANGAFWINEVTGKWCSTTYYADFPWWLSQYNDRHSVDNRIKELVWTPSYPVESYRYLPEWRETAFRYKFDAERENKYRRLITSPYANDEVNQLVETLFSKSTIGQDPIPDLLALTYYAGNYNHLSATDGAMELQDTYVRLDQSIAQLIELIDQKIGLGNVLVCISSTGYSDAETPDAALYRTPGGEFHIERCATLLNMYLMATYGEGQYVEGYYNNQIYLNEKLIENKQLDLNDIESKAEAFLVQFSGVDRVYAGHRMLLGTWSPQLEKLSNGYHRKRSGNLTLTLLPGWVNASQHSKVQQRISRNAYLPSPLILMGSSIQAQRITTPVSAQRIAPTLSRAMRIRAPNASQLPPLDL